MAPHSSTFAWNIPWMEEPGRLQSMGSLGVGHDWATSFSLFTFMHWRRKWQPTPVFLPGESQGWGGPGGLPSMGLHRVGHDWSDLAAVVFGRNTFLVQIPLFFLYPLQESWLNLPFFKSMTSRSSLLGNCRLSKFQGHIFNACCQSHLSASEIPQSLE